MQSLTGQLSDFRIGDQFPKTTSDLLKLAKRPQILPVKIIDRALAQNSSSALKDKKVTQAPAQYRSSPWC
jgi:hypothetical protein